jgi:protoporphyrinogen/coproporphyrinogen III oxidase
LRNRKAVAVIGGGVTGLAAAYRLRTLGFDPTLFEAAPQVGGVARTERRDGFLAEAGPNSLTTPKPAVAALLTELGLGDRLIEASPAAQNRYIVRDGRMTALPSSPGQLLSSPVLSLPAKLALLKEPFVAPSDPDADESVADFVCRRLGRETLDYIADPFVGGIYAGDPEALSIRHALPRVHAMEQEHGSLAVAALARVRAHRRATSGSSRNRIVSFPGGMGELTDALIERLGGCICTGSPVLRVGRRGWLWTVATPRGESRFEAVAFAGPAYALDEIAFDWEEGARLREVAAIPYAPVAVVVLGFARGAVAHPLDGFGVLVPAIERRRVLGVLFSSSLFSGRAPDHHVTLTTFVGGTRQPELIDLTPAALVTLVCDELTQLVGAFGEPAFQHVVVWRRAIPQYVVGYGRWLDLLAQVEAATPGLALAGNYREGVSLGEALASGLAAGERLGVHLSEAGASLE